MSETQPSLTEAFKKEQERARFEDARVFGREEPNVEEQVIAREDLLENRERIRVAMRGLNHRECEIIARRFEEFGDEDLKRWTYQRFADELWVSRGRASELERRAYEKLKTILSNPEEMKKLEGARDKIEINWQS